MNKKRKRFELPKQELSLSLLVGQEGEQFLNRGEDENLNHDFIHNTSKPGWLRILMNLISASPRF